MSLSSSLTSVHLLFYSTSLYQYTLKYWTLSWRGETPYVMKLSPGTSALKISHSYLQYWATCKSWLDNLGALVGVLYMATAYEEFSLKHAASSWSAMISESWVNCWTWYFPVQDSESYFLMVESSKRMEIEHPTSIKLSHNPNHRQFPTIKTLILGFQQ